MTIQLLVKTQHTDLYENHKAAFKGDSGIDLFFVEDLILEPNSTTLVDLGIHCEMREISSNFSSKGQTFFTNMSYYLYPRSSISKTPLRMANSVGIIDSEYRNSIKVAIDNTSNSSYELKRGERLFQICAPNLGQVQVVLTDQLQDTSRGSGFGSSGTSKV